MLRRVIGIGVLSLMVAFPLPTEAQKAVKKPAPPTTASIDGNQLPPGEYYGKLVSTPLPGGSFILEVEYKHMALKPNAKLPNQNTTGMQQVQRDLQHIAKLQQQLQTSRHPQQAAQHMMQLQQAMMQLQQHQVIAQMRQQGALAQLFQVVTEKKTVDFKVGDELTVRLLNLPTEYDEKGKLKPPPSPGTEEYKKLKGNTKLIGYEAKPDDLKTGAIVKIYQVKPKPPAPSKKDSESSLKETKEEKEAREAAEKEAKEAAAKAAAAMTKEEKEAAAKEAKEAKELAAMQAKEAAANAPKVIVTMILIVGDDPNATSMAGGNKKAPGK